MQLEHWRHEIRCVLRSVPPREKQAVHGQPVKREHRRCVPVFHDFLPHAPHGTISFRFERAAGDD